MDNSGPSLVKIPAKVFLTCTGCKFLEKTPGLRGRKMITNNFNCAHPDAPKDIIYNIGIHVEGEPATPIFCPFKKQ